MSALFKRGGPVLFAYAALVALVLLTALLSPGLLAPEHLGTLLELAAFIGIVALGQTFVILGAGIDLSVPWVLNCSAILTTLICGGMNQPLIWAVPLILLAGCLVGALNGLGVALFGVPPIIMTLATNVILQGGILVYTAGAPAATAPNLLQYAAVGRLGPVPVVVLLWGLFSAAAWFVLARSGFGRYLYALGTNRTVAVFSGVPVTAVGVATYVISAGSAALAGMLLAGYSGQAYLGMGDPYLFTSIAAVAIGGTSILGGSGSYLGTIAGTLCLTILTSLLPTLNLSNGALLVAYGSVILVTVAVSNEGLTAVVQFLRQKAKTPGPLPPQQSVSKGQ